MNSTTRLIIVGLILAASLYGLWPTYQLYQLNQERSSVAARGDSIALARWDSVHAEELRDVQTGNLIAKPIKLGLDLQGGMYITMEVDVPALIYESAQPDAVDDVFQRVITETRNEARTSDESVLDIFLGHFDRIARPAGKTLLNYFDFGTLGADASDDAIVDKLRRNIDDAVDQAVEVIRQRIDKYGVSETTIQKQAGRRVVVELPGVTNRQEVRNLLQTTARLEFKLVKNDVELVKLFKRIDEVLAGKIAPTDTARVDTNIVAGDTTKADTNTATKQDTGAARRDTNLAGGDTAGTPNTDTNIAQNTDTAGGTADTGDPYAGLPDDQKAEAYRADHPLTSLFETMYKPSEKAQPQSVSAVYMQKTIPAELSAGEFDFLIPKKNIEKMRALLNRPDVRAVMNDDILIAFSAQEAFPNQDDPTNGIYNFFAVPAEPELTGEVITDAGPSFDQMGQAMVLMEMSAEGADQWASITGRNIKKRVAIILDSAVYSAPTVQNKIAGGSSQITGSKDINEANLLAVVLKAGALKAPIKIIEERVVGPSLGEDSIRKGVWSTLIATGLVFLFMALYYSFAGVVANIALLFNVLITLAVLGGFNATLTLPGIGGLVLTIGMAVDGNILIYERIREELAAGKSLRTAIKQGYEKAWSAVLDTHITTLISGLILLFFGSGPIRGFAVTLIIGLLATLFTSVFVTRTIFLVMLDRGTKSISFGEPKHSEPTVGTERAKLA